VLLVEDNPSDVVLTELAFSENAPSVQLSVTRDGDDALAFLNQRVPYTDAPRPDLILLDLNMPKRDGCEVLAAVKRKPELLRVPIVVLTTSDSRVDICTAYDLHANAYVTKPLLLEEWSRLVRVVVEFWIDLAVPAPSGPAEL